MNFDRAGIAHDYRAVRESVRADGRNNPGLDGGMHDGAASGERIRGGTGGSGDDQAVSAIAADEIRVNRELQIDHAGEGALVDYRFVHDNLVFDDFGVAMQFDVEHHALAAGKTAGEDLFERGIHFFNCEAGEKAEAAHVDGEDGNAERRRDAGGGEEGAVATEDE